MPALWQVVGYIPMCLFPHSLSTQFPCSTCPPHRHQLRLATSIYASITRSQRTSQRLRRFSLFYRSFIWVLLDTNLEIGVLLSAFADKAFHESIIITGKSAICLAATWIIHHVLTLLWISTLIPTEFMKKFL